MSIGVPGDAGSDPCKDGDAGGGSGRCPAECSSAAGRAALALVDEGKKIFRYDTFGDQAFWGGQLRLHDAIQGAAMGGVGDGLSPVGALALGLKVDVDALPGALAENLASGRVDLDDPAVTVELIAAGAVLGVVGFFQSPPVPAAGEPPARRLSAVGITCAFCHSTVDDSFAAGIGHRLDGWPNQDLDVGTIVALAPNLRPYTSLLGVNDATVRTVLRSWGPGKYDALLSNDGKAFHPDGGSAATLIPPALRLAGVNLHTWTGWGSVAYWNAYVAVTQMHGLGTFHDPRLDDARRFPIAAANRLGHVRAERDLVTPKLPALHVYQLALPVPTPPGGYFDPAAAARGQALFSGKAECSTCHVLPLTTEPGYGMHTAAEIGIDDFQAMRSPDGLYRTAPLRAIFTHDERGFYHDGRFPTLEDVVEHYDALLDLGLTEDQKRDLVEYVKSL